MCTLYLYTFLCINIAGAGPPTGAIVGVLVVIMFVAFFVLVTILLIRYVCMCIVLMKHAN